jgi:acyl carrier protein
MPTDAIAAKLQGIFRDVFDDDSIEINRAMVSEDVPEWDSVAHVRLMVAVEKAFDIRFDVNEINDMPNVGVLMDMIAGKTAKATA